MHRALIPALVLLALACDKEPATGGAKTTSAKPVPPKPPAVLPTTGNPKIRAMREDIVEEVNKAEKDLANGTKPQAHLVANWKKGIDYLIAASELAVKNEAEDAVRSSHALLRARQSEIDKQRNDLAEGILEIQRYLDEIARGVGKAPEGFTEDELKDRLGERQEQARALEKEEDEVRAQMQEKEDLLTKGNPPPQSETLHTHELEALKELKARIDALEKKQ
jgi:hypothetical protein